MPFFNPTYDGVPIFGLVTSFQHVAQPTAQQLDAFAGVQGTLGLFLGTRGRAFVIAGVLNDSDIGSLNADEGTILSYADGITHALVDTRGRSWSNVIFEGQFTPDPMGPRPTDVGWCLPYHMIMRGLT